MISRTLRFASLAGAALVVLAACLIASAAHTSEKDDEARRSEFLVGIASPEHNGKRTLSISRGFPVVITNLSKRSLGVWREWCSWGYYTLSLEARTSDGRKVQLRKKERTWTRNIPDYWKLAPGESLVRNIVLSSDKWKGIEELQIKESVRLFLRVVLEVPASDESKEYGVWSGKVASPEGLYQVEP